MIKDNLIYLEHILDCLQKIQAYTQDIELQEFITNSLVQDALIRKFEVIGEATKNISKDFKATHSKINWADMARMRDKLIHHYFDIDLNILWDSIHNDVPDLLLEIEKMIAELPKSE